MLRTTLLAAVVAGVSLVVAPAGFAHGIAIVSVAQASYQPGDPVVVSGTFVDPDFAAIDAPAVVRIGEDGPVLAQAPIAADGTWSVTFVLPLETILGTYALHAEVLDSSGQVVKNLLARTTLQVGAVAAPVAPQPATVEEPALRHGAPTSYGSDAPIDLPTLQPAASAPSETAPAVTRSPQHRHVVVAARRVASRGVVVHATPVKASHRSPVPTPVVASAARVHELPAAPAPRLDRPTAPSAQSTPALRPQATGWRPDWRFGLLALLAVALGTAGAAAALARRRSPLEPLGDDAHALAVEAELQEIVAEERARRSTITTF